MKQIPVMMLTLSLDERDTISWYDPGENSDMRKALPFDRLFQIMSHLGKKWVERATWLTWEASS